MRKIRVYFSLLYWKLAFEGAAIKEAFKEDVKYQIARLRRKYGI